LTEDYIYTGPEKFSQREKRRWETIKSWASYMIKSKKEVLAEATRKEILFRNFAPVSGYLPKTRMKPIYRLRGILGPDGIKWLGRHHFNQYLLGLQFKMTPDGVKRYIDGKEVEQKFYKD
jgi:hypothetical protein